MGCQPSNRDRCKSDEGCAVGSTNSESAEPGLAAGLEVGSSLKGANTRFEALGDLVLCMSPPPGAADYRPHNRKHNAGALPAVETLHGSPSSTPRPSFYCCMRWPERA